MKGFYLICVILLFSCKKEIGIEDFIGVYDFEYEDFKVIYPPPPPPGYYEYHIDTQKTEGTRMFFIEAHSNGSDSTVALRNFEEGKVSYGIVVNNTILVSNGSQGVLRENKITFSKRNKGKEGLSGIAIRKKD